MDLHETALQLLKIIPEHRMEEVAEFLWKIIKDEEDDLFCEQLLREYEQSPDKGIFIPEEDIDWENLDEMFED